MDRTYYFCRHSSITFRRFTHMSNQNRSQNHCPSQNYDNMNQNRSQNRSQNKSQNKAKNNVCNQNRDQYENNEQNRYE